MVYWREIPSSAVVIERKATFEIVLADGERGTAYWLGKEEHEAKRELRRRARTAVTLRRSRRQIERVLAVADLLTEKED